jgi:hypothetical protein
LIGKFTEYLLSTLWTGDISSIGATVRATYEVLKSFDTHSGSNDNIRSSLRDFQKTLVREKIPAIDVAEGLPRAFAKVGELRELTERLVNGDIPPDQDFRDSWSTIARSLHELYDEEVRYAADYLKQRLKTIAAICTVLFLGHTLTSSALRWPSAALVWLLGSALALVCAVRILPPATKHRQVQRHRKSLQVAAGLFMVSALHPLLVLRAAKHTWTSEPWPERSRTPSHAESLSLETLQVLPAITVHIQPGKRGSRRSSSSTDALVTLAFDPAYATVAASVEFTPEYTEQLLPVRFDILDEYDVHSFLENELIRRQHIAEEEFSRPFPVEAAQWQRESPVDKAAVPGRIGLIFRNLSQSEIGPGTAYIFPGRTRQRLGLSGRTHLGFPSIPPRQAVATYLTTDPDIEPERSFREEISREDLQILLDVTTEDGSLLGSAIAGSTLSAVPRSVKSVANMRFADLIQRPYPGVGYALLSPVYSTSPKVEYPSRNAMSIGWDAEIQINSSEKTTIRAQVRELYDRPTLRGRQIVQELRLRFSSAFPLKSEGTLRILTEDGSVLASLRARFTSM